MSFSLVFLRILDLTLAKPERYYSTLEKMKKDGIDVSDYPSYEEVKQSHDNNGFIISPSQNWNVHSSLKIIDTLLPLLKARNWGLVVPQNASDTLICSDNPLLLMWTEESLLEYPPGFGLRNTRIYMPLSSNIGLMGLFTPIAPIIEYDSLGIACLNHEILLHAKEQVYSREMEFNIFNGDNSLRLFPPKDIYTV